jgi:hypothetical protein
VLSSKALTHKGLELAQKLDLYRLFARAGLAHEPTLPTINGAPFLALAEIEPDWIGIAAADPAEAVPDPIGAWGPACHDFRLPPHISRPQTSNARTLVSA